MSKIPILLLKTKSIPKDSYEEHFSTPKSAFSPTFIPVLEHQPNAENLQNIKALLRGRRLNVEYGGMIFTSQRAVEAFARVVGELELEQSEDDESRITASAPLVYALEGDFPLYVVGPATERTLGDLVKSSRLLSSLKCKILGGETGHGEKLARFMLQHYNQAHYRDSFEIYEAPRLPFVPLVGNRSEQYPRLEKGDHRLRKRPLLFLVGEQRRDVIPKMLTDTSLPENEHIRVHEVEVYKTGVMESFEDDFRAHTKMLQQQGHEQVVIVVFSPSGCEAMLKVLAELDEQNHRFRGWKAESRDAQGRERYIVVTIGPTTERHLQDTFGFRPQVVAERPSPEGTSEGLREFLERERAL